MDDYDNAQGQLIRGVNGNISTKFPADGRYEVILDACGSSWAHDVLPGRWTAGRRSRPPRATTTVRLTEGAHRAEPDRAQRVGRRKPDHA